MPDLDSIAMSTLREQWGLDDADAFAAWVAEGCRLFEDGIDTPRCVVRNDAGYRLKSPLELEIEDAESHAASDRRRQGHQSFGERMVDVMIDDWFDTIANMWPMVPTATDGTFTDTP